MPRLLSVLLGALLLLATALPAQAQSPDAAPPSQRYAALPSIGDVDVRQLPAADHADLAAAASDGPGAPYRYGALVDAAGLTPETAGTWEQAGSETWVWRLRLQSDNALSISVAFSQFDLPEGARLYAVAPSGDTVHGPYVGADATAGRHRTPLVQGDEIVLELRVPADQRGAVGLTIDHVVHGFRPILQRPQTGAQPKDGACNLDVTCPEGDPWFPVYRSVGLYTYQSGNFMSSCTGSLINTTSSERRPLFLTAEHCITDVETAASMVFYWNYQSPTCRTPGTEENAREPNDDRNDQTSTGAILRARYGITHTGTDVIFGRPDLTIVEVDDVIPNSYNLYYAGWDRSGTALDRGVTVHHPAGDAKRISFEEDPIRRTAYDDTAPDPDATHWLIGDWEVGTTEGGSSGSPLYTSDQLITGVLSGGRAACVAGSAEDNDRPDWYGSLAKGFFEGDYNGVTIADVLDPANTGQATLQGRPQAPDRAPPSAIDGFRPAGVRPDSVVLRWEAPGDDGTEGRAIRYDLRFRVGTPINTEADFEQARRVEEVPTPGPSGTPESVTVPVDPDSTYYFALQAIDDVGKRSPLAILRGEDGNAFALSPSTDLRLETPIPNPVRTRAQIRFSSPEAGTAEIAVYDALGREVRTYPDRSVDANRLTTIPFEADRLSPGIYFVRLRVGSAQAVTRAAVVR